MCISAEPFHQLRCFAFYNANCDYDHLLLIRYREGQHCIIYLNYSTPEQWTSEFLNFISNQYLDESSFVELQFPLVLMPSVLCILFSYFWIGQKLRSDLLQLSDDIYQLEWHRYPRSLRRFVSLMMMRAQKPFYINAFGFVQLKLETFVDVSMWELSTQFQF